MITLLCCAAWWQELSQMLLNSSVKIMRLVCAQTAALKLKDVDIDMHCTTSTACENRRALVNTLDTNDQ